MWMIYLCLLYQKITMKSIVLASQWHISAKPPLNLYSEGAVTDDLFHNLSLTVPIQG
jgi:hypothetical protein